MTERLGDVSAVCGLRTFTTTLVVIVMRVECDILAAANANNGFRKMLTGIARSRSGQSTARSTSMLE